jgi:hypothetical protein
MEKAIKEFKAKVLMPLSAEDVTLAILRGCVNAAAKVLAHSKDEVWERAVTRLHDPLVQKLRRLYSSLNKYKNEESTLEFEWVEKTKGAATVKLDSAEPLLDVATLLLALGDYFKAWEAVPSGPVVVDFRLTRDPGSGITFTGSVRPKKAAVTVAANTAVLRKGAITPLVKAAMRQPVLQEVPEVKLEEGRRADLAGIIATKPETANATVDSRARVLGKQEMEPVRAITPEILHEFLGPATTVAVKALQDRVDHMGVLLEEQRERSKRLLRILDSAILHQEVLDEITREGALEADPELKEVLLAKRTKIDCHKVGWVDELSAKRPKSILKRPPKEMVLSSDSEEDVPTSSIRATARELYPQPTSDEESKTDSEEDEPVVRRAVVREEQAKRKAYPRLVKATGPIRAFLREQGEVNGREPALFMSGDPMAKKLLYSPRPVSVPNMTVVFPFTNLNPGPKSGDKLHPILRGAREMAEVYVYHKIGGRVWEVGLGTGALRAVEHRRVCHGTDPVYSGSPKLRWVEQMREVFNPIPKGSNTYCSHTLADCSALHGPTQTCLGQDTAGMHIGNAAWYFKPDDWQAVAAYAAKGKPVYISGIRPRTPEGGFSHFEEDGTEVVEATWDIIGETLTFTTDQTYNHFWIDKFYDRTHTTAIGTLRITPVQVQVLDTEDGESTLEYVVSTVTMDTAGSIIVPIGSRSRAMLHGSLLGSALTPIYDWIFAGQEEKTITLPKQLWTDMLVHTAYRHDWTPEEMRATLKTRLNACRYEPDKAGYTEEDIANLALALGALRTEQRGRLQLAEATPREAPDAIKYLMVRAATPMGFAVAGAVGLALYAGQRVGSRGIIGACRDLLSATPILAASGPPTPTEALKVAFTATNWTLNHAADLAEKVGVGLLDKQEVIEVARMTPQTTGEWWRYFSAVPRPSSLLEAAQEGGLQFFNKILPLTPVTHRAELEAMPEAAKATLGMVQMMTYPVVIAPLGEEAFKRLHPNCLWGLVAYEVLFADGPVLFRCPAHGLARIGFRIALHYTCAKLPFVYGVLLHACVNAHAVLWTLAEQ